MKVLSAYERAKLYIEKHYNESEEVKQRKRRLNPGPIITISRQTGIGAAFISERLAEYFTKKAVPGYDDWTYFDKDLVEKVIEDHHLPEHFRKFLSEEKPGKIDSWISEMLGISPSKFLLLHKTSQTILKLAEMGNVIFVENGSNFITSIFSNAFHIRLIAPIDYRVENAVSLYNVEKKKAAEFIKEEDHARKEYIWKYFHKDIDDPLLYHAMINVNYLKPDEIAEMIGHCVMRRFPTFFIHEHYNSNN